MSSYWDYLKNALKTPISSGPAAFLHAGYDMLYDNSHGSDRYWLSKVPGLSWNRRMRDEAKQAEDRYQNTGTDEAYINRVNGFDGSSLYGGTGSAVGAVRMARSLTGVYQPDVIEDLARNGPMYGRL